MINENGGAAQKSAAAADTESKKAEAEKKKAEAKEKKAEADKVKAAANAEKAEKKRLAAEAKAAETEKKRAEKAEKKRLAAEAKAAEAEKAKAERAEAGKPQTADTAEEEKPSAPVVKNPDGRTPMISIRGLHKAYGEKKVLKGLDLDVYEGELFGFIGKNGIGKSTTIDCVIGSKRYDAGSISLAGFDVKEQSLDAKRSFGYVASEPSCYEVMSGYDYLEFIANIYQLSEGDFVSNYKYLCSRLKLDERELANPASDYSHGMKQKLCLVASLLHNPKVWILDEPTVGLDIMAVEELKLMMREYANHGKTVFVTSHNIDLVARLCDRVAIINDGKVAALYDLNRDPNRRIQLSKIFMDIYRSST
ncbi:MAG: ABC transporter ATP-binding protein [Ruminococcaceae bacterium]|nr:ABC transporter ATP-binding protein [Oscillospiraceae bacterium]